MNIIKECAMRFFAASASIILGQTLSVAVCAQVSKKSFAREVDRKSVV